MVHIIIGDSGVGKTTIAKELASLGVEKVVTYTSREKRLGEKESDYNFSSEAAIRRFMHFNELVEMGEFYGSLYATSKKSILAGKDKDISVIIEPFGAVALELYCQNKGIVTNTTHIVCEDLERKNGYLNSRDDDSKNRGCYVEDRWADSGMVADITMNAYSQSAEEMAKAIVNFSVEKSA